MEIFVCVKRVPLLADDEIKLNNDKTDIQREGLVYALNEWDNYAIEEAIRIKELVGGKITLVTVGNKESEEIIYRGLAMGVPFRPGSDLTKTLN
jgi:electron transfer flavoprotein beta subunit